VHKGTTVIYSAYCLHRRQDLYGLDAEIFRPERWEEAAILSKNPTDRAWGYMPFGGGPRVCLGSKPSPCLLSVARLLVLAVDFALTEVAYTIVRLLQRFPSIALADGEKVEPVGVEKQAVTIVLRSTDGCKVKLG
jgi:hypothetical protein